MGGSARIEYQPALDGVRALAVVAVLLFHAGTPGFDGGYLGVSVFFTLSGYLITSLLVREHDATGRIDLAAFYGRRLRRLLPASVATIAAIVAIATTSDLFDGVSSLRGHVLGSAFQIANWVFLAGDGSYQELLAETSGTPSPLEHFWSLSIEEQFYWLWPVCMLVVLGRARGRSARIRVVGAITGGFAVAAPVIAQVWGPDAAYWATPARLSEILVGAFLAVVYAGRSVPDRVGRLAPPALAALAAAVVLFPAASGPAYEGALPLVAVASGVLLLGLQAPGPLREVLSTPPLVGLGKISYGVYLYHWPIYVLLDADRLGVDGLPLTLARVALTLVVSIVSYLVLEQPIRRTRRQELGPTIAWSALATGAVAALAVVAVPAALGDYWRADDAAVAAAAIRVVDEPLASPAPSSTLATSTTAPDAAPATTGSTTTAATTTTTTTAAATTAATTSTLPPLPPLARPVRVVVTGDSTADALGTGVIAWAAAHPELAQAEVVAAPGCGFVMGGERRHGDSVESVEGCTGWVESQLLPAVERTRPDVVVLLVTSWDVIGRRWDTEELLSPLDADFRRRIDEAYAALVDDLAAAGAGRVVLLRQPVPDVWWLERVQEEDEPERHRVIYEVYAQLAATRPGFVEVVAFDRWFSEQGYDRDAVIRPDGVHLAPDAATSVVDEYLGEQFVRAALGMATS